MISAREALKIVEEAENRILGTPKYVEFHRQLEEMIRKAANNGERHVRFKNSDFTWPDGRFLGIGDFYYGEDALRVGLERMGYKLTYLDSGENRLYW